MARKVILDVDTGSDDAVAIMTAALSPDIDLEAVCTVWGNKDIEKTTQNTLDLVSALGIDVPVYKGCDTAMVKFLAEAYVPLIRRPPVYKDGELIEMHSDTLGLPHSDRLAESIPAAMFYVNYLRSAKEPVTLVPVGPLTNLGLAFRIAPDIVRNVEEIVIMGGGCLVTNMSPCAESNIWNDPGAAHIVQSSGAKIVYVSLDATHRAVVTKDDCKRFRELNNFAGTFAAKECEQRIIMHTAEQPLEVPDSASVHDALCIAYLIDPTVITDLRYVHVEIGLGGFGAGQTIVDPRNYVGGQNAYFSFNADRFKFADILYDCFRRDTNPPIYAEN